MNKYPKYKTSGIEWIGDIPAHWDLATVGRLNNTGRGRVISAIEIGENIGDYPVYSSQTENDGIMGYLNTYDFEGEYVTWTTDGANAGTVFYREGQFNCTNVCGTIQPKNWEQIDLKFLPYFLNLGTKFSVRLDINPKLMNNMMGKIPLVIPPKPEQTVIANFLDKKTAQIDKLITNKQKLIELLKEERMAIINKTVTRGINPNVKLKPSGVDWLGDIPEHWEVKKLKYVVSKVGSGITPRGGANVYQNDGIPLLRSQNIYNDGLRLEDVVYISEEIDNEMSNSRINDNDVLLNITGASIGRCFYVPEGFGKGNVNQHVCIIRPIKDKILTKYVHLLLISGYGQALIDYCQNGANREGLNFQEIKSFDLPLPKIEEQIKIIQNIAIETKRIDATIFKIENEIELMQEYRTALISEVVTGKIKVI
jgi:type I restriction enzyme S subunit